MATAAQGKAAVGTIKVSVGDVKVIGVDGVARNALVGERVFAKEIIQTSANGLVQIQLENGRFIDLGRDSRLALDENVTAGGSPATAGAPAGQDIAAIQAQIAAGADPSKVAEATAAGGAAPGAGGADGGGGTPLLIEQANSIGEVTSGFNTGPATIAFPEIQPELLPVIEVVPPPVVTVRFTDGEVGISSMVVKEDGAVTVNFVATVEPGGHLVALTVTGFDLSASYDFSALGTLGTDYTFDGTTLTILNVSGNAYSGSFVATPSANSDVDLGTLTVTGVAASDEDANVTSTSTASVDIVTDAVADQPSVQIAVSDSEDGGNTFQSGESGSVTVSAQFGDSADGSETHTVTVTIPEGFTVSGLPSGAAYDAVTQTVTFSNIGSALNATFTITNVSSPDGTVTFTATASALDEATVSGPNVNSSGAEVDASDNFASVTSSTTIDVISTPTPQVNLTGVGTDPEVVWVKEDGASGTVNVSATTNTGSALSTIVITGFKDGFAYDFSGLSGTVNYDAGTKTLTISGLSGTSYNGTFTVTPTTEDSDADLGILTAVVTAASTSDSSVTAQDDDTVTVRTDAVLDEGVDVAQNEIPEVNESAEAQIISLNLDATIVAPFAGSGNGGDDTDASESVTATVTLSAGVLMLDGESTNMSFTGTADEVVAWLESLQVQVPAGYNGDGTITGTVSITATDAETDSENTTADNVYNSNNGQVLNFTVNIDSVPVANDDSAVVFTGQSVTINLATNDQEGDDSPGTWSEGGTNGQNYVFSATGNNAAPGVYQDNYTLTDSDGDSDPANITVTVLGGPTVTLGAAGNGDEVWVKEDGAAQSVNVSATAASGSHLTQIVITGFKDGFTYDFSGLDTDAGGPITFSYNAGTKTLTISGLSGNSYNGTFTVAPTTPDSDADLGTLSATATVAANANSSVTTTASDTTIVRTDAVLDEAVSVAQTSVPSVGESASAQTVGLNLNATIFAPFDGGGAGFGGSDTDGSESTAPVTATVTLSAGTLYSGGVAVSSNTFTGTAAQVETWLESLQVRIAGNFDGTINGTVTITATDTPTDAENDTSDNTKQTNATFSVTVVDGVPSNPQGEAKTVEEESIPLQNGNDESDGLSYTVSGTFSDNANWGPDGFGSIVNVTTSAGGVTTTTTATTITLETSTWRLVVTKSSGDYVFEMKDNIVGPQANNGETAFTLPVFNVTAQDGDGDPLAGITLTIDVIDDTPIARHDYDDVTLVVNNGIPSGSTSGNVFTNDSIGADTKVNPVTSVTFNGVTTNVTTNTEIQGTYGKLTISSNGAYTYLYNTQKTSQSITPDNLNGATFNAFDDVSPFLQNGNLNLAADDPGADVEITGGSKSGFGVKGNGGSGVIDVGEELIVALATPISGSFQFQVGQGNTGQGDFSNFLWSVYDSNGVLLESGNLVGATQNQNGTYTGPSIEIEGEAKYVVFTYTGQGQGYVVTNITYDYYAKGIDDFTYNIVDADGDISSAHLYLTSTTDGFLAGDGGNNTLTGTAGQDILQGNGGNDTLVGGQGDDVLAGGLGSDTFKWNAGDQTNSTSIGDKVTDFQIGSGGDVLDLASLLTGEHSTAGVNFNLGSYLTFAKVGDDTVLTIDTNGAASGTGTAQKITFVGADLFAQAGVASNDSAALIQSLLGGQNLKTDL